MASPPLHLTMSSELVGAVRVERVEAAFPLVLVLLFLSTERLLAPRVAAPEDFDTRVRLVHGSASVRVLRAHAHVREARLVGVWTAEAFTAPREGTGNRQGLTRIVLLGRVVVVHGSPSPSSDLGDMYKSFRVLAVFAMPPWHPNHFQYARSRSYNTVLFPISVPILFCVWTLLNYLHFFCGACRWA